MPDGVVLSEQDRAKLDGIVQKMMSNKESEDNIRFVVDDFKNKYGLKKKGSSEPTSQEKSGASPTRPIQQGTSSDTEPPMGAQASGGLGGQTGNPFQSIDPFGGKGAVGAIISEQQKTAKLPTKKAEDDTTYSYPLREKLYPGEDKFFKENPNVGGMAAEDQSVILNPYSSLNDKEKQAIITNETARLAMRGGYERPTFELTPEQKQSFKNYSSNIQDQRETIVGRILSGDPSAGNVTTEQKKYAEGLRSVMNLNNGFKSIDPFGGKGAVGAIISEQQKTQQPSESYAVQVFKKAKSEVDENTTEERLLEEKNQSGILNNLGIAAKSIWNVTGAGLSSINEALGGTKDYFTIDEYKPLQEEKIQAKRELEKEGLPITGDNIQKRAEDIFRINDKRKQLEKRIDANLPEDYDRQGIWKELKLDNLKKNSSLKETVISADIYQSQIKEFEKYHNYFKTLPREKITQEQVDKYNELLGNANESLEGLKYLDQKFPKMLEEVKSSDELLDVFKYNYNDYEKHLSNIKNFAKGIAGGTVKLMEETARYLDEKTGLDTDVYGFREGNIKMANEVLDEASEDREQFIKYKAKDISNFSDVGSFMAGLATEQIPVWTTLAIAPELGPALLGAGTGGEQFRTMEIEESQPFAKKTSFGQKLATSYMYGGAEALFERLGTVSVLKNIEKSIAKASNPSRKLIEDGVMQEVSKLGKQFGYNFGLEGGTEYLTAEAQIAADRYIAGKEISTQQANERRFESFVAGGLMGGGMTMIGGVWGAIAQNARIYSDNKDIKKTKEILSQIERLSDEIKNNPNLTPEEKVTVYKKMNELTNQSFDIVSKNAKKGKDFNAQETQFLVDINVKQAELKAKLQEIKDSNFSKEQKETFINELKDEYSKLEEKRNTTLQGGYNKLTELPSAEVIRLKDKAARELMKELNPDGTKTITINDSEITKRAIQLLESETKAPAVEEMSVKPAEAKPTIESPIELKEGEELVDVKQDKKGNTYTYVAETSEKDSVKTTKFKFNRSDKSSEQRNPSGVDTDKVLDKYGYEITADQIQEGAEIIEINEIREGEKTTGATVTFKDAETGNTFQGEIVLQPKAKEAKAEEVIVNAPLTEPTIEQQSKDVKEGNVVTFEYENKDQVPEVFKDKISSSGEINGKPYVKVTVAKSLADFQLQESNKPTEAKAEVATAETITEVAPTEATATEEIAPSEIETTLDEVITPASSNIKEQIARAKKAISKFLPNVEIVYHTTAESFQSVVGDNSRGYYDPNTKKIHINGSNATNNTVAHEVFHAVILKYISSDKQATALTNRMFKALAKSLKGNPKLLKEITEFSKRYEKREQSEEKLAEVLGYLASEYETLPDLSKNIIQKWIENIAKTLGIKKFTDQEVVDFMNTIATKVSIGQEITEADVKILESGKKIKSPTSLLGRRSVGAFDVVYTEQDKINELIKNNLVTEPENTDFMSGKNVAITSPDDMLVGSISIYGNIIFEGGGGVFFVTKYGDVWASGNQSTANTFANAINKSLENNKGNKGYLVLTKGTDSKLLSSSSGVNSSLSILDSMLDNGLISLSDFRSAVSSAVKTFGGEISLRGSAKQLKEDVNNYFSNPKESTFQKRGDVVKKIIETIAQSKNTKINKDKIIDFLGGDKNKGIVSKVTSENKNRNQSLSDLISGVASEKLTKGLNVGDVYAIIEVNGEVTVKEDSHPSYPFHVVQKDGKKPILHLPKLRENGSKTITTSSGKPYSVGQVSIMSGTFNDVSGRKQLSPIDQAVKVAKNKGFNDKEIADYLVGKGYTRAQATKAILRYNDITAVKLRKEDSVFTKEGRNKIVTFLDQVKRRALSARSFLPKSVFLSKDKIESNIKAEAKRASYLVNDFNKLVKGYKGDVNALNDEFDKYLRGDKTAVLPNEFKAVAGKMRMHIDNLSQMLLRTGAVSVSQAETIAKNLGQYVNRSYQVFDKKDWAKQVTEEMREAAKVDLRNMYRAEAESKAKQTGMDADIILEDFINKKIEELIGGESAATFLGISKTGAKNLSIMKERLDIPLSIRQLMGEYTDASQNYARTVLKIATLAENSRFLQSARESGMGVFFFNENDPNRPKEFNTKIAGDKSDTMSPLNGLYTTPEIAKAFAQKIGTGDAIEAALGTDLGPVVRGVYETYMKALSSVKWLKTIGSVATHAKNVTGNLWFMLSNGYYNPKKYAEAFSVLKNSSNEDLRNKLDEYIRAGIIDQSAALGEIKAMFADADFDTAIESRLKKNPFDKAKAGVKKLGQKMTTAYQLEDDFFKIISYESEKARYSNASFDKPFNELTTEEQNIVKEKASEITKNILPNYARIPGLVKLLKAVPVTGTFVSFQAEAYRTAWNTVALAADELKSDNNKVKAIGAKRLAGIAASQAAKLGLMALMGTVISGGDDDDDDELKKNTKLFVAPWSKESDLVLVDYGGGKMSYIDFSASDPHGGIKKAYNSVMAGKDITESFTNGLTQLLEPFMKEDMLLNVITDIKDNKNAYGGKLYNESDTDTNKINAIMGRVYKAFEPGTITTVRKVVGSDDVRNELAAQLTGYKISTVDVNNQLGFNMNELKDLSGGAKSLYSSAFYKFEDGTITGDELDKIYEQANKSQKEVYEKMMKYMNAASFFGVDDYMIEDNMQGVGKSVINDLWYGEAPDMKMKEVEE